MKRVKPDRAAARAARALRLHADKKKAATHRGFFKNAEKDVFLRVGAPLVRKLAREFRDMPLSGVEGLMASQVHDERSLANAILVLKYRRGGEGEKKRVFDFYLRRRGLIRNWDGVDDSAPYIVGPHLLERDRSVLFKLAGSRNLWDRRIAVVSTWWFIRRGDTADTFRLARRLLGDGEDLIHKAVGWMLREAGKRDPAALRRFLSRHAEAMPRTMLRYAIERFPERERRGYLAKGGRGT